MKSILLVLLSLSIAQFSVAASFHDGADPVKISISAKDSAEELFIDIATEVEGNMTLSIFSESGEIVINESLLTGSNRVQVRHLRPGQYVAVVRHNDAFSKKQEFKVN